VTAASTAVHLAGLWKRFDQKVAVSGVDLVVPRGSFLGLVGRNGAGKTTTLRMATGLLRPDVGRVLVAGHDVWADAASRTAAKGAMGVLPDDPRSFDRLAAGELLLFHGLLRGLDPAEVAVRRDELLDLLELAEAVRVPATDFSTGMRKKLALACALLHAPAVVFLDEPFESVDPVSARAIRRVLERFTSSGGTVVFSSHVMETVERLCDRVAVMDQGRIVAEGTTDEVTGGQPLDEVFARLVGAVDGPTPGLSWLHSSSG
jgi:ABC-2 type transport system ATP-binding protein